MRACPACGASNGPGDDFCGNCGTYLGWSEEPQAHTPAATSPERPVQEPSEPEPSTPEQSVPEPEPSTPSQPPAPAPASSTADAPTSAAPARTSSLRSRLTGRSRGEADRPGTGQTPDTRSGADERPDTPPGQSATDEAREAPSTPTPAPTPAGSASGVSATADGSGTAVPRTGDEAGPAVSGTPPRPPQPPATPPVRPAASASGVSATADGSGTAVPRTGDGSGPAVSGTPPRPPQPPAAPPVRPASAPATRDIPGPRQPGSPETPTPTPAPAPAPAQDPIVAVRPAKPQAPRPVVRPTVVPDEVAGRPCPSCGTPNPPDRRFCRRCATDLKPTAKAAPLPWWRTVWPFRRRVRAGSGRAVRLLVILAVVVALCAGVFLLLPAGRALFEDTRDKLSDPKAVTPSGIEASAQIPGHPAKNTTDGLRNRYWGTPAAGASVKYTFGKPFRMVDLIITNGASKEPQEYAREGRALQMDLEVTTADGERHDKELTLSDKPGPQTIITGISDVKTVRLVLRSPTGLKPGRHLALAEVEFFQRG
ncbi:zinc ribbon domain-containing protein [Streptomyces sp. NBC_00461]|uniref:NADase-type glycan-binding domain-containing protein n=1 Tax=Streptomyces sp. NBC_00461 TaxID=2975750 RepID=UPI002E172574